LSVSGRRFGVGDEPRLSRDQADPRTEPNRPSWKRTRIMESFSNGFILGSCSISDPVRRPDLPAESTVVRCPFSSATNWRSTPLPGPKHHFADCLGFLLCLPALESENSCHSPPGPHGCDQPCFTPRRAATTQQLRSAGQRSQFPDRNGPRAAKPPKSAEKSSTGGVVPRGGAALARLGCIPASFSPSGQRRGPRNG